MIAVRVTRDGMPLRESLFPALPVTLGRDAGSDFVLLDESVSRRHAVVEESEAGLVLRDLGSRNGVFVGAERRASVAIAGRLRCRLGAVDVEVERLSDAHTRELLPAEWPRAERRRTIVHDLGHLALAVTGFCAGLLLDPSFWSPWEKNRGLGLLAQALAFAIGVVVASFLLLIVLKAAARRVRMADTLRAASRLVWLWPAMSLLSAAAYYALDVHALGFLRDVLLPGAALGAGAAYLAGLGRPGSSVRFRLAWASVLVALFAGLRVTAGLTEHNAGTPAVDYTVQPPVLSLTGPEKTLDAYLQQVEDAAAEADRDAAEVRRRQQATPTAEP